ncbi:hypothetical protein AAZV13_17G117000 [Glycine max]
MCYLLLIMFCKHQANWNASNGSQNYGMNLIVLLPMWYSRFFLHPLIPFTGSKRPTLINLEEVSRRKYGTGFYVVGKFSHSCAQLIATININPTTYILSR